MAKSIIRIQARDLRKKGFGIKTISHKLHVSSSTVSLWCRDIQLTDDQINELGKRAKDPFYGKRLEYIKKQQMIKQNKIELLKTEGINEVGSISNRDLLISGINLYWAEGFKKDSLVGFSNSDPNMILVFIKWLTQCCNVSKERIKFRIGINEQYRDHMKEIEKYWENILCISPRQFQKPYFQKVQWKKIYEHPEEYHGVLRVRVAKSINLLRKINGWIEGMKLNL